MKPATFRELAAVEAKVIRALRGLSPEDQVRVLESVERGIQETPAEAQPSLLEEPQRIQLGKPDPVPVCHGIVPGGMPCTLYAGHCGEHRS
jgi:hypothetical protein